MNECFVNHIPLLYVRFKKFLASSDNRIDFIKYMDILNSSLDELSDVNEYIVNEKDIIVFSKIHSIHNSYSPYYEKQKNIVLIDKLITIKILTKIL